jgi:hypothetical protein
VFNGSFGLRHQITPWFEQTGTAKFRRVAARLSELAMH